MTETFNQITKLIKSYDHFIIMAHKSIDLDAFGSALCLYKIIESFEKDVRLFLNRQQENNSIQKSIESLEKEKIHICYMYEEDIENIETNTLLFILDTNKKELVESAKVLDACQNIAVIDHHIISENTISNPCFIYVNNEVSSTAEIMVHYLKYLKKQISPLIATILMTGLIIDTNTYNIKTTDKTYETAAILMKMGANNIKKQQLLKEDKENYFKRQTFVKNSTMITENIALCVMDRNIYKRHDLALIAEDLLQFDDVEVSFVIGYIDYKIAGISARSIGEIDVEQYMRLLGGGGHKTDAACTIKSNSLDKVKRKLLKIIEK